MSNFRKFILSLEGMDEVEVNRELQARIDELRGTIESNERYNRYYQIALTSINNEITRIGKNNAAARLLLEALRYFEEMFYYYNTQIQDDNYELRELNNYIQRRQRHLN